MGAELSVDSRPGAGSSFKVRMFFSDAPPSGTAAPAGARIAGYAGPRRRILVTDDDPAHLAMVRNVLAPLGFDLVFADNGEACLAVCRAQLPDLDRKSTRLNSSH